MACKRRPRSKVLPEPPSGVETPYANCRLEWQGVGLGEKTKVVLDSAAWQDVMIPALIELEADRPRKGPDPSYSSEELERAVLFQKVAGVENYKQARNLLASDRHAETRELLGFDKPRTRRGKNKTTFKSLDGVPSEVTVWRHEQRWGLERHIEIYEEVFQRLLHEHLEDPDFQDEARVLNIDGSVVRSHYTSFERVDWKTGEIKPPTLEGGGYMPRDEKNIGKDGHGFNMVSVTTPTGLPLAYRIVPLATKDHSEADTALAMFREEWQEHVAPLLDDKMRVLTADGAYTKGELRAQLRQLGIVENTHPVSHGKGETNKANAEKHDAMVWQIEGKRNWRANGHRELYCVCGAGKTIPRISRDKDGRAVVRVEGDCKTCGSITITSGLWRVAQNPRRFTRCKPGEADQADWLFGNPFTFNNKQAKAFGSARFGHGEGFHGHLLTRFGLLKHKAWYRRRKEAQLDFLMVFCSMHALAIEQRKRAKVAGTIHGADPPELAAAA
jgi:Transposase DDE domain